MTKHTFTLQQPIFSDSDTETPLSNRLVSQYNREYSLIYQEIKSFLKQCKENINKYIQLNQFGVKFNMFALYAQMTSMETATLTGLSDVSKQQLDHQNSIKLGYQKEFQNILQRMENVIRDFLNFQINFKREYFGISINQPEFKASKNRGIKKMAKSSIFEKLSRQNSHSGSSAHRRSSCTFFEQQTQEKKQNQKKESQLEQKLREILKRKLAPQKQNIIKFCDKESEPFKNMSKLEQKIDMMQSEMILSKTREEKIIEIFNKRRIENIRPKGHGLAHSYLIETGSGHCVNVNNEISKNKISQLEIRESSGEMNRKDRKLTKPSLDMDVVNQKTVEEKVMTPNDKSTPRQLISPRGMRSPKSRIGNGINFFCSPKNGIPKRAQGNKAGFRFKKKKQSMQDTCKQKTLMSEALQRMVERERRQKGETKCQMEEKAEEVEVGWDGGVGISQINKNREKFLQRRKSNNQNFRAGVSNFFD